MQTLNGNNYYLNLKDPFGTLLTECNNFIKLDYARSINNVGALTALLPISFFPYVRDYSTLEVWRTAAPGAAFYLDLETIWIIVSYRIYLTDKGELLLEVKAVDGLALLLWRYVMYFAGSAQASKSGLTGDQIKAVVRENVASTADDFTGTATTNWLGLGLARGIPASVFTVQADKGDGASVALDFSWRNVLDVLQSFAAASNTAGTYMAFDVVSNGSGTYEFRTYAGQRGSDHRIGSLQPVVIDPALGNSSSSSLTYDYSAENNAIYCAGQGEGSQRTVKTAGDATRLGVSPFSRREYFQDARQSNLDTQIQNEANGTLRSNRGKVTFDNQVIQTAGTRYGIEYNFGDILPCKFQGRSIDCRLEKINVTVEMSRETILARLQSVV